MGGDSMYFPENPEEFIDSYKFKDSKEYYTNGSDLIQVFRVKQMLDHYLSKKEVKHGKWIMEEVEGYWIQDDPTELTKTKLPKCSCCGKRYGVSALEYNCCPNCGAKMDKE